MKHFNRYSMAALPLLSILAMSPSTMESHFASRGIASVEIEKIEVPKVKLEVEKFKPEVEKIKLDLNVKEDVISKEDIKSDLKLEIDNIKPEIKKVEVVKDLINKEEIKPDLKVEVENIKPEIKKVEIVKDDKMEIELQEIEAPKLEVEVADLKPVPLDIDTSDLLLVEKEEIKPDAKVVVDDIKPDIQSPKVGKVETEKETKAEEVCEQDEKVKALSGQIDALVAQQNQIMQSMLNMSQMMMMQSMMIQQQMMMSQMKSMGTQNSPYQYANQTTSGNWVYHPQGFQPQQQNIFSPQMGGGFYPDQAHTQSSWNLTPGTFGPMSLGNGMSFDMTPGGAQEMPIQAQAGRTLGPIM